MFGAVTHFSSGQGNPRTVCGLDMGKVRYFSFQWKQINCKRCLRTVESCSTMFRRKER